jgi:hypothetical protein
VIQGILTDSEPETAPTKFVPLPPSPETIVATEAATKQEQLPSTPSHQEGATPIISETGSGVVLAETQEGRQSIDYFPDPHT